jgi:AcrR family transcriptional regulator
LDEDAGTVDGSLDNAPTETYRLRSMPTDRSVSLESQMAPRISNGDRETKRRTILRAAADVFARQGYLRTRVADVAAAAGVGKGTVYEYFESKEELLFGVWELIHADVDGRIAAILAEDTSARTRLEHLFDLSAEIVEQMVEQTGVSMEFWAACRGGAFEDRYRATSVEVYRRYRRVIADVIRDGQRRDEFRSSIDADALAIMIVSAHDGLGVQMFFDRGVRPRPTIESFVDALASGLCPEPAGNPSAASA